MIEQERWLPVLGWETIYEVSNFGQVKRIAPYRCTHIGRILKHGGWKSTGGYASVHLRDKHRDQIAKVHQLVMQSFVGPPPEGHVVNHLDFNRRNPRLDNLEYVTQAQNVQHSYAFGNLVAPPPMLGVANHKAKLTEEQIKDIREQYTRDKPLKLCTQTSLAHEYGVSQAMISCIVRGANWTHI